MMVENVKPVCTVGEMGAGGYRWLVPHPTAALNDIPVGTHLYAAAIQSAADTPAAQAQHDPDSDPIQVLSVENERLRHIVSDCAAALMTGAFISPKASVEFMEGLPKEISLVVSALRAIATKEPKP